MDCDHPEYIKDSTSPSSNRGFQNRIFTNPLIKGQVLLENHVRFAIKLCKQLRKMIYHP